MADTDIQIADTNISVLPNWILVSDISVSVLVSATLDIGYIGIGQISAKIHGYRPKYRHISAKIPVIGQISAKIKISVLVSVADMLVQIYWYRPKYGLGEYICIGIDWIHIVPTLLLWMWPPQLKKPLTSVHG